MGVVSTNPYESISIILLGFLCRSFVLVRQSCAQELAENERVFVLRAVPSHDVKDKKMTDEVVHEGGCLCGATRYSIDGPLVSSAHCHCRSCQLSSGAGFATWALMKPSSLTFTKGTLKICETSPGVERGFCGNCGTSLTYANEGGFPGIIGVLAVTFDDPSFATPSAHVYVSHQQPWIKLADGLPTSEEF